MITTFIFDIGNVVWEYKPLLDQLLHRYAAITNLDYDNFYQKYLEFYSLAEINQSTLNDFALSFNQNPEVFWTALDEIYSPQFNNYLNQPLVNLIKNLKTLFKVGYLSNAENFFYSYIHQRLDPLFDFGYTSWQLGLRKPDTPIYQVVLEKQQLSPSQVVFIDDTQKNLVAPQQLGLKTILYQNNQQFLSDLSVLNPFI